MRKGREIPKAPEPNFSDALTIGCPACGTPPGQGCVDRRTYGQSVQLRVPHVQRTRARAQEVDR